MKPQHPISPPEITPKGEQESNLLSVLSDPRAERFFGRPFQIKAAVLAALLTGEPAPAELARRLGISRQLVHWHSANARRIYLGL